MDAKQFPSGGFQIENALSREEALRGITIWSAKAAFEERIKGSLEKGKLADFILVDKDLMKDNLEDIRTLMPAAVFLNGKRVK
jgi:predicted amidohydrolase YtcJ